MTTNNALVSAHVRSKFSIHEPTLHYRLICWNFPPAGCIKINTDGSSSMEDHRGGFEGLVRRDQGKWVEGFCGYIGYAETLKAELWRLRHALKLCKERNSKRTIIETDCLNVVNLIKDNEDGENHPNRILLEDCKVLVTEIDGFKDCSYFLLS